MSNLKFPPIQFALFRIIFGLYLCIHFAILIPHSNEIGLNIERIGDVTIRSTYVSYLNILTAFNSPLQIKIFVILMTLLSCLIIFGIYRRIVALLLCYGWYCFFPQNSLICMMSMAMVWCLLIALTLIPIGEPFSFAKKKSNEKWFMSPLIFWGAWWLMGIVYTISGIYKLVESWDDSSNSVYLVNNSLAEEGFVRQLYFYIPLLMKSLFLGAAIWIEISFGFLCLFKKTRKFAWFLVLGMQLINLIVIKDFLDLTVGMMMIHFFTFDPQWFQPKNILGEKKVVLYDGVCCLCNGFANFLIENDLNHELHFSHLQSNFAKEILDSPEIEKMESVIFFYKEIKYTKSKAAILAFRQLGGIWYFLIVFLLVPTFIRDFIYDLISRNRYKLFGKHETCRIPTPEERSRFLD